MRTRPHLMSALNNKQQVSNEESIILRIVEISLHTIRAETHRKVMAMLVEATNWDGGRGSNK